MLPFIVSACVCMTENCIAPLNMPEPVENMELEYIAVLLRHGARTPQTAYLPAVQRGYWLCDSDDAIAPKMHGTALNSSRRFKQVLDPKLVEFLPNCRTGDLLLQGMEQHYELGKTYRKYLYETNKLFTDLPTSEELYLRSTDFDRTFRSAQSFLNGAFPPETPNEVMVITRGNENGEVMRPGAGFCSEMKNIAALVDIEKESWAKERWAGLKHIADYLKIEYTFGNVNLVADWVGTHDCDDKLLPSIVKEEDKMWCHNTVAGMLYNNYDRNSTVFVSYSMREVLRIAKAHVAGENKVKFNLLSAHDSTLATFIAYLTSPETVSRLRIPPYRSHLTMEIWKDKAGEKYVRWVFNGQVLKLKEFGDSTLVSWKEFEAGTANVYDHCIEMP